MTIRKSVRLEDIAAATGLSKSTIDRVLHGRPGVSASSAAKIEAALLQFGYTTTALEAHLSAHRRSVAVLLPAMQSQFYSALRAAIVAAAEPLTAAGHRIQLVDINLYDSAAWMATMRSVGQGTGSAFDALIVVAHDASGASDTIRALEKAGTRVITLMADAPKSGRSAYIGPDNFKAGRMAGSLMARFVRAKSAKVAVLIGDPAMRHHLDRRSGFEQIIASEYPGFTTLHAGACRNDWDEAERLIRKLCDEVPDLAGLYVAAGGQPGVLRALKAGKPEGLVVIGHELTETTRQALLEDHYSAVLAQDLKSATARALRLALADPITVEPFEPVQIVIRENLPDLE